MNGGEGKDYLSAALNAIKSLLPDYLSSKAIIFIIAILPPSGIYSWIAFAKKMSFIETFAPTINFEKFSIFVIFSVAEFDESRIPLGCLRHWQPC